MFFEKMQTRKKDGITLVELIVVIAILAILAGIGVPAYSGYVEKANIAADQQLAYDVANALQLYYYNNYSDETAPKSGYVILTTTSGPSTSDGMAIAMNDVFGEDGWADLKLKSADWKPAVTAAAVGANGAGSVNDSTYVTDSTVTELLDNVQTVTSAAAGLLGSVAKTESSYLGALEMALGADYLEKAANAGIIKKSEDGTFSLGAETDASGNVVISQDMQNQLANMMVFSVAEELKNASTEEMQMLMLTGLADGAEPPEGYSTASVMAARYALYKAYALDSDDPSVTAAFNEMNTSLNAATGTTSAITAIETFYNNNATGLETYLTKGYDEETDTIIFSDVFNTNAASISAIMNGVSSVSGDYTNAETLKNPNVFTSDGVSNQINAFIGAAALGGTITADQIPANGIIVILNSNGTVGIDS